MNRKTQVCFSILNILSNNSPTPGFTEKQIVLLSFK